MTENLEMSSFWICHKEKLMYTCLILLLIWYILLLIVWLIWISDVAYAKRGEFTYDGNFEFILLENLLNSKWHLVHQNWSTQSGVINEIMPEILIVFFFAACFYLFLENMSSTVSPFELLHHIYAYILTKTAMVVLYVT